MASRKLRLDDLLVSEGRFASRDEVLRAVVAGEVLVDEVRVSSPALKVAPDAAVRVVYKGPYVSRGGEKLAGGLAAFALDVQGLRCIDCGCSTGGFTDCLLQHGAAHVAAVDVGYGDFSMKLRRDARVALFERTNIREADPATLGAPFDLAVADVSFAPLHSYIDAVVAFLAPGGHFLTLVKPQFEAARSEVGEGGVVVDPAVHARVLADAKSCFEAHGLAVLGSCESPIRGRKGNKEYLLLGRLG